MTTDGAVLLCYSVVSLLLAPRALGEAYLASGRLLYGVLPTVLGLGSLICALLLSFEEWAD